MGKFTPRNPRPRSTLGPLMLQALGALGAMTTDEYLWEQWEAPLAWGSETFSDPGLAPMPAPRGRRDGMRG